MSLDLSQIPALKPPDGVIPNLIDPYTRGPMILALSAVAIGFMYLFVAVRFYSKFYIKHTWTWDDGMFTKSEVLFFSKNFYCAHRLNSDLHFGCSKTLLHLGTGRERSLC